jgi:hypothetical protein
MAFERHPTSAGGALRPIFLVSAVNSGSNLSGTARTRNTAIWGMSGAHVPLLHYTFIEHTIPLTGGG